MKRLYIVLFLIIALGDLANAQNFYSRRRNRTLMFSYGLGASQYHGDLHDILYDGMGTATGYSFGIGLRKKFGDQLSLRLDLNHYQIGGSDADNQKGVLNNRLSGRESIGNEDDRYIRNLSFRARNWELSLLANLNLIPVRGSYSRRPIVNPYLIAGVGFTTTTPKGRDPLTGDWVKLAPLNTEVGFAQEGEQQKKIRMVVPLGLGIRLKANQYIDILLEGARRFTFTDYLDDISTKYPSVESIRAYHQQNSPDLEELAVRMYDRSAEGGYPARQEGNTRGNPERNDSYYIFQIRLEMYLPDSFLSEIFSPSRRKPKFR